MDTLDSFWNVGFLLGPKSTPTLNVPEMR